MKNMRYAKHFYVSIFMFVNCLYMSSALVQASSFHILSTDTISNSHYQLKPDMNALFTIVRTELKKPEYLDRLPNDFSDLNQLLVYGQEIRDNRQEYVRSVLGVFSKVMGGCEYVNAYAFAQLLEVLPQTLKPYFVSYKIRGINGNFQSAGLDTDMFDRFKEAVSAVLYVQFSSQYDAFKSSPVQFFDELSQYIADIARRELHTQHMRVAIKRFGELAISKLVWSPEEHKKIWGNVKRIAYSLALLAENNILDPNELDEVYWTFIHRINYFFRLMGADLPVSFYENIRQDIASNNFLLWTLAEQDVCIQTKKECLQLALLEAEAKSRAYEKGIIVAS